MKKFLGIFAWLFIIIGVYATFAYGIGTMWRTIMPGDATRKKKIDDALAAYQKAAEPEVK